jgi:probable phosphoglycerate mutase
MTTFGLIRHGATEWNRLGKLQGQMDTKLTDEGRGQARLLGRRLDKEDWDFIVCSDLERASETARIISAESGIPLSGCDPRLRERTFGLLEGTTLDERLERYGPDWKTLDLGVESDQDVFARWSSISGQLLASHSNGSMLIVSHGSYIGTVLRTLGLEKPDGYLTNASLTRIERKNGRWSCSLYSCIRHLQT